MDPNVRSTLFAAGAAVCTALITSGTAIWISSRELQNKIQQAEAANKQSQETLKQTTNLLRYIYDNGTLSRTSLSGGKMVVRVNGSAGTGPVSHPIDMSRFEELCGDEDGCTITLAVTRFLGGETKPYSVTNVPLQGAPCRFFWLPATKEWSLSQYCVATFGLYKYSDARKAYTYDRAYQIYEYSYDFGKDDSYTSGENPDSNSYQIMSFKGACYLAEAAPDTRRNNGKWLPDDPNQPATGRGLHLVASSPLWDFPGVYPAERWPETDPQRACVLIVED